MVEVTTNLVTLLMLDVNLADAKARLSELVERAAAGEPVRILKRGKVVARIVPPEVAKEPVSLERLQAVTDGAPFQEEGAGEFMRRLRDDASY